MKISARNVLTGVVKKLTVGDVEAEVVVALPDGSEIVSVITADSAKRLELKVGRSVHPVIKASNVMIMVD